MIWYPGQAHSPVQSKSAHLSHNFKITESTGVANTLDKSTD